MIIRKLKTLSYKGYDSVELHRQMDETQIAALNRPNNNYKNFLDIKSSKNEPSVAVYIGTQKFIVLKKTAILL